jgi:hypothetical protein
MVIDFGLVEPTKANMLNLCDIDMILGLWCVLPMTKSINVLVKFAQSKDVFVHDYIIAIKICQVDLYKMYGYSNTSFQVINFPKFIDSVINTYCRIA